MDDSVIAEARRALGPVGVCLPASFTSALSLNPQYEAVGRLESAGYRAVSTNEVIGTSRATIRTRAGMSAAELVDRLGWLGEQGVTFSAVPLPRVSGVDEYLDYARWVIEEIKPQLP